MGSAYSQAIIKIDDVKQSFGEVPKGTMVELKYMLTNIGTEPLILTKYEVECSCTSAIYDNKPVLPGNSTTVVVKFDTKSAYGRQDRIVRLSSNNKNGDVKLRFKGMVDQKVVVQPD